MGKAIGLLKTFGFYFIAIIGILLFSAVPELFRFSTSDGSLFNFKGYYIAVKRLATDIFQPDTWVYTVHQFQTYSILDRVKEPYLYSMTIFGAAILIAFLIAFFITFLILLFPKRVRKVVMAFLSFVESIPDIVVAYGSILLVIFLYKVSGVLLFKFAALGKEEQIYFLPILALTILPTIYFIKVMVASCEEELDKNYVDLARSKGLRNSFIVLVHVFRNISESLYYHSKTIIWFTLSNLMIIEYLFNINGVVTFIGQVNDPKGTFLTLVLIFTPFYLLFSIIELFVTRKSEEEPDELWDHVKRPAIIRTTIKYLFILIWKIVRPIVIQFRSVKFIIGFVVIMAIFGASFYHQFALDGEIPQTTLLYEDGKLVDAPPLAPSEKHWLGTDRLGFDMFYKVIDGAKYTLSFAILIAFLRIFISSFLGVYYAFYVKGKFRRAIEKFVEGYHYLPISLIALILLRPILWMPYGGFNTTFTERIILEVVILTILALPVVSVLLGSEMKLILNEEYITSTKILGGGRLHVLWKHVRIHLGPKLGIIFGQQIVQVLLLFTHLGLFQIFFGGTDVCYGEFCPPPQSMSNEWGGLIGDYRKEIFITSSRWIMGVPLGAFMITAMAISLMVSGMRDTMLRRQVVKESIFTSKIKGFYESKVLVLLKKVSENKKLKRIVIGSLAGILVIGSASYLYIKNRPEPLSQETLAQIDAFTPAPIKAQSKASYDIKINANPKGIYDVTAKVKVENLSEVSWDKLLFYMIPNLFTEENLEKHQEKLQTMPGMFGQNFEDPGMFQLKKVLLNGKSVKYDLELEKLSIPLSDKLAPKEQTELEFVYQFTVPPQMYMFGQFNQMVFFGQFYPMLAVFDDDGWEFRDFSTLTNSFYLNPADFNVAYKMSDGGIIGTSDQLYIGDEKEGTFEAKDANEFFMISHDFNRIREETINGVKVRVLGTTRDMRRILQAQEIVKDELKFFEEKLGQPFPHKQLDIVISFLGMTKPGVILTEDMGQGEEAFKQNLIEQLAEEWVGSAIRNDPYQDAWLKEGIAQFMADLYRVEHEKVKSGIVFTSSMEEPPKESANTSIEKLGIGGAYQDIIYGEKPAIAMWKYFKKNGGVDEGFDFLSAYFDAYAGGEITTEEFVQFFRSYNKLTTNEAFENWLDLEKLDLGVK